MTFQSVAIYTIPPLPCSQIVVPNQIKSDLVKKNRKTSHLIISELQFLSLIWNWPGFKPSCKIIFCHQNVGITPTRHRQRPQNIHCHQLQWIPHNNWLKWIPSLFAPPDFLVAQVTQVEHHCFTSLYCPGQ